MTAALTRKTQLDARQFLPWAKPGEVPTEFALFYFGENESTKGSVWLDAKRAGECLATWKDYGNKLLGDYNHGAAKDTPEPVPASCEFELAIRADGLYAVNVEWTARAKELLLAREYKYYSPYFYEIFDGQKWWVTEIINVALTNQPATKRQRPLVWSRTARADNKPKQTRRSFSMDIETIKKDLADKGMNEEQIADFIAKFMPADPMPVMEMAADPVPVPAPAQEQFHRDPVVVQLQQTVEKQGQELAAYRKAQEAEAKAKRNALFSDYDRQGKLRYTDRDAARRILEGPSGERNFVAAFSKVEPLVNVAAPPAPNTPPAPSITASREEPVKFGTRTLSSAVVLDEEVKQYQAKHAGVSYTDAMIAISAEKKKASTRA